MKRLAEQLIAFFGRHRSAVTALVLLSGLLAGASLFRIRFTNDVSQLFPDSQDAGTTFRVLNETKLGNTVQLEFISPGPVTTHEKYLDSVAEKIARLPGVKNLVFRYRAKDVLGEVMAASGLLPRFYGPEILKGCDPEAAVRDALKQLSFPTPGGVKQIRNQPFGLETRILMPLIRLDLLTGMVLSADLPYFATKDQRRAMMVFDADIMIGDAGSVRKLLTEIRHAAEPLPQGMEYRVISGAMHTLGNEETLKRDAAISGTVSLLLFLLIFLIFYRRDWRTLWIPAIPLYGSLLALGIMTLFFREICLYVIGLGSCITGLAIDQGIHVYAAFRGPDAERKTAALTEPMLLSAATSILVFVFLAFTGIRAYIQLAVFAGLSLAISCLVALAVLPLLLDRSRTIREYAFPLPKAVPVSGWTILLLILPAAWGLYMLAAKADLSLESLDGTPEAIRKQESDFNSAWRHEGTRPNAVLAVSGTDREEVLTRMREICRQLTEKKIFHAGPPMPPQSEQIARRNRWRTPEAKQEIAALEKRTREACRKHRLPETFFQPFFDRIRAAAVSDDLSVPPLFDAVMKKMVKEHAAGAAAVALLEDQPDRMPEIRKILNRYGGGRSAILSKGYFRMLIRNEMGVRFLWILPLSILSAVLLAWAVFRKFSDVMLALVPVYVSFCGLFILGALAGFKATPAAAFALILLTGLAVDYGIYAVSQLRHPDEISVRNSVFLSAATTVAGAGALVFSKHPALFGTGVVLSVGITLACLSGLYLVPMLKRVESRHHRVALLFFFMLIFTSCATAIPVSEYPDAENLRKRITLYPENGFRFQANAVLEVRKMKFTFILAGKCDPAQGVMNISGISGAGTLLFRMNNDSCVPGSELPREAHKALEAMRKDFSRIFLLKAEKGLAVTQKTEYIRLLSDDGTEWHIHPEKLVHKKGSYPFREWECTYSKFGREVFYRSHDGYYTIRLTIRKLMKKEHGK